MLLKDLQSASFRGADFLVPKDETTEGRNSVIHDYPDQVMRYVEDNGLIPPLFRITAIVHGEGLQGKVSKLRTALKRPGPGVLRHPVFGNQFVSVDQTYTIDRSDRESGIVRFRINFVTTGAPVLPGLTTGIPAVVSQLSAKALQDAFQSFLNTYKNPSLPFSIKTLADGITHIADTVISQFGQASGSAKQITTKSGRYAQNISLIGDLWVDMFRNPIDDLTITNTNLIKGFDKTRQACKKVVAQAEKIEASTLDLETRKFSLKALGEFAEFASFISIAEAMAVRTYLNSEQVDADEGLLYRAYASLQESGLPSEQHDAMKQVYVATADILQRVSVRLPRISEIEVHDIPASVLAYSLYEKDGMNHEKIPNHTQSIINLNENQNPSLLKDNVNVLIRGTE